MLDIKLIRENPQAVKEGIQKKGENPSSIDTILTLDSRRRELIQQGEQYKSKRNAISAEVGKLKREGKDASSVIAEMEEIKNNIKAFDDELAQIETDLNKALLTVPNIPHPDVPVGKTPEDNKEISRWGEIEKQEFEMKPHWELVQSLDIIDFERGVKVTGAGFPIYKDKGAKLQRALINFFLDEAATRGYKEIQPPLMINTASATGTGQLPDKEDLMYTIPRDEFFMVPTAEVPVTNIFRDEILAEKDLPIKFCAYTPCFRREAGSYGKDVRGLNRLHQFDKVELVKFVHPEQSYNELESLREDAERLLQLLGIPYRVLLMCTGDMGFTQTKKYDLEVWAPAQKRWLEVSSISNFESFQARRMNIRFRPAGGKPEIIHTLNGSGLALPRVLAALIEQYQTPEAKVIIPRALHKYTGFEVIG